jgi:pimeloyl-ACP methyl ester carboxylesterase
LRVVTYDGPGNGRSDRPLAAGPCGCEEQARTADAVLDATGTDRAVLVSLSMGALWALWLMANRPERVLASVSVGASVPLGPGYDDREQPSEEPYTSTEGWAKYNRHYWLDHDRISPLRRGAALAEATGGALVVLEGAGHIPLARRPVKVNLLLREFVGRLPARSGP